MKDTLNTNNKILPLFSNVAGTANSVSTPNSSLSKSEALAVAKGANAKLDQSNLAYQKSIGLNQILDLYLQGMSLYKTNLNNYLTIHNKLVASLILQLALRSVRPEANKEYELNVRISNF